MLENFKYYTKYYNNEYEGHYYSELEDCLYGIQLNIDEQHKTLKFAAYAQKYIPCEIQHDEQIKPIQEYIDEGYVIDEQSLQQALQYYHKKYDTKIQTYLQLKRIIQKYDHIYSRYDYDEQYIMFYCKKINSDEYTFSFKYDMRSNTLELIDWIVGYDGLKRYNEGNVKPQDLFYLMYSNATFTNFSDALFTKMNNEYFNNNIHKRQSSGVYITESIHNSYPIITTEQAYEIQCMLQQEHLQKAWEYLHQQFPQYNSDDYIYIILFILLNISSCEYEDIISRVLLQLDDNCQITYNTINGDYSKKIFQGANYQVIIRKILYCGQIIQFCKDNNYRTLRRDH